MHLRLIACLLVLSALSLAPTANAQTFTGNITSATQFDIYTVNLTAGVPIQATLVCDEVTPGSGNRPLDPTLAIYFPGNPNFNEPGQPSPVAADLFNDDGFTPCNAFSSSIIEFRVPATGQYRFRAEGFSTATGPYTLTITNVTSIPTMGEIGVAILVMLIAVAAAVSLRRRRT